ncbi:MAG: hypothetical protein ACK5MH_09765 [Bacteroidales bacterium]
MEYKMKELSEYDASYIKAVYYNDLNIVHLQNYDRISNMISNLEKYLNENEIIIKDNNIINLINQKFEYELYDIDYEEDENNYNKYYLAKVYYFILSYILKKDIGFEIENYKANRYFLDIIIDTLTPNKEFNIFRIVDEDYYNNRNTSFIPNRDVICYSNRARGIIEDIVNIVRHYDSDLKERALLHFDLLEESILNNEETYYFLYNRDDFAIDSFLHELIIEHSEKIVLEKLNRVETNTSIKLPDNIDKYNALSDSLKIGNYQIQEGNVEKIEEDKKYISANNNEGTDENVSVEIIAIKNNLSKKQVNSLVNGLVSLDCIDNDSKDDMLAFLGNKTKTPINKIDWKATKILCAYFVDKFNSDI